MWLLSECGRYWVRMATSKMPELTQFESGKSMMRNLPANGTEGLARFSESTLRRAPSPPARIIATTRTGTSSANRFARPQDSRSHLKVCAGPAYLLQTAENSQNERCGGCPGDCK